MHGETEFWAWSLNFPFSNNLCILHSKKKVYKNIQNFDLTDNNKGKISNCNIHYGKTKNINLFLQGAIGGKLLSAN